MFPPGRRKSFKRPLNDSLAADVNPRSGCHLSVHRQSHPLEAIELGVVVPLADEIRICDQDPRCFTVRPEFADRFSRLDKERFVVFQFTQRADDCIECFPASGGATSSTVNHELIRILCDVRIEIVHQHPHCRFLMPAFARGLSAARRMNNSLSAHELFASPSKSPRRIASATCAMSLASERSWVSGAAIFRK